jgi:YggT family protein
MRRQPLPRAAVLPASLEADKRIDLAASGASMRAILDVILIILHIYTYIIIIVAILSWLIAFHVINIYNDVVRSIWNALNALTEPLLRPIRRALPNFGGIDISPVILLLLIFLLEDIIARYIYPYVI